MLRLLLSVVFAAVVLTYLSGQPPSSFHFKYLKQGSGVEDLLTNCVFKDRLGVLWIGSNRGIRYYDGVRLQVFDSGNGNSKTATSAVMAGSFVEDRDGRLWIGTDTGLVILSADRSVQIQPYTLGIPDSVSKAVNSRVQTDSTGDVYVLGGMVIYRMNVVQHTFSIVADLTKHARTLHHIANFLFVPKEDAFYLAAGMNYELFRYKKGNLLHVNYPAQQRGLSQVGFPINSNLQLFWLRQDSLCLVIYNPNLKKSAFIAQLDHTKKTAYYDLTDSLQRQFPVIQAWYSFCRGPESPLPPSLRLNLTVLQLIYGTDKRWYLATNAGVFIAEENIASFHAVRWTKGYSTRAITKSSDGTLLVGSYNHLLYGNHSDSTCKRLSMGPPWCFFQKRNKVWDIFSEERYSPYQIDLENPDKPLLRQLKLNTDLPYHHTAVAAGRGYWSALINDTLYYSQPETGIVSIYIAQSVQRKASAKDNVKRLFLINNTLWVAGNSGLQAYELSDSGEHIVREITTELPDTLRSIAVNCLYSGGNGQIWIGTAFEGLLAYDLEQHTLRHWTTADGLAHFNVYSITGSNSDSVLWIGTQHGLSRLEVWNNTFCNYHTADGLLHDEFNNTSVYKSDNGVIFMGGPNGVSWFRPEEVPIKPDLSPGFVVVEIQNTRQHEHRRMFPSPGSTLTLQPEDNYVGFAFRSSDFFKDNDLTFRYRLIGLQDDWRYVPVEQEEVFTAIRPGEYLMEVQTQTNTGVWTTIYTLNLDVLPAWHQTWWFKVLVVLALALVFHTLYTFRLRQLRKEYELRKQVSDDLHDDLGSRIFALKSLASKVALPDQPEATRRQASEQFETLSKEVLGRVRDFIWVFNPENDQLIHFLDRLDDYIRMTIMPLVASINFSYDVDEHVKFASKSRHHLMMILQELLVNMSKHTRQPVIQVTAQVKESILYFHIFNRHTGIQSAGEKDRQSYGLSSIEKRLTQYDIRLNWNEDESSQTAELSVKIAPHA